MAKDKRDVEIGLHRNLHLTHLVKEKICSSTMNAKS